MRRSTRDDADRLERRRSVRRDAINAWNTCRLTGEHAAMLEVDAWLARLQAGEDAEPPGCRRRNALRPRRADLPG